MKTEKTYLYWIRYFIRCNNLKHIARHSSYSRERKGCIATSSFCLSNATSANRISTATFDAVRPCIYWR
ncbi:hypothetical protein [Vibrio palustris]|uniref:hypothetical protein n=1 Tax=Vibrio palustris TaxID=1918946 RepID=UPI0034D1A006